MKTLHVAAAVIRDDRGRVFAARRGPGRAPEGFWEFPGGKVEPGESAAQALVRTDPRNRSESAEAQVATLAHFD